MRLSCEKQTGFKMCFSKCDNVRRYVEEAAAMKRARMDGSEGVQAVYQPAKKKKKGGKPAALFR